MATQKAWVESDWDASLIAAALYLLSFRPLFLLAIPYHCPPLRVAKEAPIACICATQRICHGLSVGERNEGKEDIQTLWRIGQQLHVLPQRGAQERIRAKKTNAQRTGTLGSSPVSVGCSPTSIACSGKLSRPPVAAAAAAALVCAGG